MELAEALRRANQILDEESAEPTLRYSVKKWVCNPGSPLTERQYLEFLRSGQPRHVFEDPSEFVFSSDNYTLLCALQSRLPEGDRDAFVNTVLARMHTSPACVLKTLPRRAARDWDDLTSELPLLAEFSVRNGAKLSFLQVLGEANPAPGHVILLRHLEEMIAFNYTLFSEEDYQHLATSVCSLLATAERHAQESGQFGGWQVVSPGIKWTIRAVDQIEEITAVAQSIKESCRKARYLHLKGSLLPGVNLEVNQDKQAVESYLRSLGFSQALCDSLNEAERLYQDQGNAFTLKSSMGHLRSFLEGLHAEKMPALHAKHGGDLPTKWGAHLAYLRNNGVISKAEEQFTAGLFTLISDEGVHPVVAEREYARLARNMVIEYGLLFLRNIEKLGLGGDTTSKPPAPSASS